MNNLVRTLTILLVCSLVAVACLLLMYRHESDSAKIARQELAELKIRLEGIDNEMAALKEQLNQPHDGKSAPKIITSQPLHADLSNVIHMIEQLFVQQSNILYVAQSQTGTLNPTYSPETALRIRQVELSTLQKFSTEKNEKMAAAKLRLAELMTQLSITDELAALDISAALATPSLRNYWPYFEAKMEFEDARDLDRLVKRKINIEEIDMGITTARHSEDVK